MTVVTVFLSHFDLPQGDFANFDFDRPQDLVTLVRVTWGRSVSHARVLREIRIAVPDPASSFENGEDFGKHLRWSDGDEVRRSTAAQVCALANEAKHGFRIVSDGL